MACLLEAENWLDYPQKKQWNDSMKEDPTFPMQGNNSPPPGTSILGLVAEKDTPMASVSKNSNKRDFSDSMDTEEEDTTNTPKNKKFDNVRKLV